MKIKFVVAIFLFLGCLHSEARSQWQNVAPNLIGRLAEYGSITFKDGVVWAGVGNLFFSLDTGKTWTQSTLHIADHINDIEFFDRTTGLVATSAGVFITKDQGSTWNPIGNQTAYAAAGFGRTSNDIFLTTSSSASVATSTDGGNQWTNYGFASFGAMTRMLKNGSLASLGLESTGRTAQIAISTDFGQSWTLQPGTTKYDCYNFVADLCDENSLYVVNEEVFVQTDGFAQLFTSTDVGATWSAGTPHKVRYFNASMAITPAALYMGTCTNGVQRSTDHGATWVSIGGPSAPPDTRDLAAVDNNILFAADSNGSIFRTMNSGGSPVVSHEAPLAFLNPFVHVLFASSCADIDTILEAVVTSCAGSTATLTNVTLTGSGNFSLLGTPEIGKSFSNNERIGVSYSASTARSDSAYLNVRYVLGGISHDTSILLKAHGFSPRGASSFSQGTLHALPGNQVTVKVAASIFKSFPIASLTIRSITYWLKYDGTVIDMSNTMLSSLIVPRPGWQLGVAFVVSGRLRVTENNIAPETLGDSIYLGTTTFTALFSSTKSTTVYIDQIDIQVDTGTIHLCVGGEGDYLAHISVGSNGVAQTRLLAPAISLYPNPANSTGSARIDIGSQRSETIGIQLFDILGREIRASIQHLNTGTNQIPIDTKLAAGTYYIRLSSSEHEAWAVTKKLIVQ
jgi:photosystem II stability/assembly factor-like uncharacterized protein